MLARQRKIIFVSHQWLAWTEPDPDLVHYNAMIKATEAVVVQTGWPLQTCYLWVDYHSVPQMSKQLQALATSTLPLFGSQSSIFVVIAPQAVHADTRALCDFETYQRRMWCRAEVFSFYCRRAVRDMYKAVEASGLDASVCLTRVKKAELNETIMVFEGDCACCARSHKDSHV